jgi:hypothetical protein
MVLCCLVSLPALAQPDWAKQRDVADKSGHTFSCEGAGATDAAALTSAFGVCNDKLCKVCGVEVESVVKTKETLSSVGMERLVTERCRRVRKSEPKVKWKTVDCGPTGCRAWIQIFYSKADEEAECPQYASEKFSDPARCELDIENYARVRGRHAENFKARLDALDAALADCKDIDVRPTPAMMALDAKLHAGLDSFEHSEAIRFESEHQAYYSRTPAGFREDLRETKTLIDRFRKVRNYVHDRFLVFSVFDAAYAKDLQTPAGVQRLLAAMQRCPPGARYGATDDVNISVLWKLKKPKVDTTAIGDFIRKAYPVDSLRRSGNFMGQDGQVASFFAGDDKVSAAEWDYVFKGHQIEPCNGCLSPLLEAHDHGGDDVRFKRLLAAYDSLPAPKRKPTYNNLWLTFMPTGDAEFLLRIEPRLPATMQTWYDGHFWEKVFGSLPKEVSPEAKKRTAERFAKALAREPVTEEGREYCDHLSKRLDKLEEAGVTGLKSTEKMFCWCLKGPYQSMSEQYHGKNEMVELAALRHLGCRCPFDPSKTRAALTFDWKKGQTPKHYGPYAEKKARFTIQVDPAWHSCAKEFTTSRLLVNVYQGKTPEEAQNAKYQFTNMSPRLDSPKDSTEANGVGFCADQPRFVGWDVVGSGEYAALNSKRVVLPIPCD